MDIYRKDLTGKIAEFVNKKYKTHRRVPDMIMMKLIMKLIIKIIKLLYK